MKHVLNKLSACVAYLACTIFTATAYPDVLVLRGGAELEGVLLDHRCDDSQWVIRVRNKDVPVLNSQVVESNRVGTAEVRYQAALKSFGDQLDDQWQLALWCQANGLRTEQAEHLKKCLEIKPTFADAERLLQKLAESPEPPAGEGAKGGQNRREQIELEKQRQEAVRREQELTKTVQRLARALESKNADQVQSARAELADIRDPLAVRPLLQAMATVSEPNRIRIVDAIAAIADPAATYGLAVASLVDESANVRSHATELLSTRKEQNRLYVPVFGEALGSQRVGLIYNAAEAVVELEEKHAVPYLIAALVTPVRTGYIRGEVTLTDSRWMDRRSFELLAARPKTKGMSKIYELRPLAKVDKAKLGKLRYMGSDIYVPRMTGGSSLVPPNGAAGRPRQANVPRGGGGDGGGGGSSTANNSTATKPPTRGPDPIIVTGQVTRPPEPSEVISMHQHEPVLAALRKLTDQDFGYDQIAWWDWLFDGGAESLGIRPEDFTAAGDDPLPRKAAAAPDKL